MTRASVTLLSATLVSLALVSMTLVSLSAPVAYGLPGNPMDPPMPPSTMGNLFKRDFDTVAQCSAVFRRSKSRVRIDYKTNMPYVRVRISHDGGLTYRTHPTMFPGKTGDAGKTRILGCRAFGSFCSRGKIWGDLRIGLGGCQTDTGQCMPVDEECRVDVSGTAPPTTTKPDIPTIGAPYRDPRIAKGCAQTDHDTVRFTAKWEGVPARGYPKVRDTTTGTVFIPKRLKKEADGTVKPMISAGRFSMGENEIDYEVPVPADWTHNRVWEIEFHVGPAANEKETAKVIALDACMNAPEVHKPKDPGDPPDGDGHIITAWDSKEDKRTIQSVRGLQLKLVSKNDGNAFFSDRAPIAKSHAAQNLVSDFDRFFSVPVLNPGNETSDLIWGETAKGKYGRDYISELITIHITPPSDCVDSGVVFSMSPRSPQSVHLETGKDKTPGPAIYSTACVPVAPSNPTIANNGVSVSVDLSEDTPRIWRVIVTPDEAAGKINSEVIWRGDAWAGGEGVVNAARPEEPDKCGDIEYCDVSVTRTQKICVAQNEDLPDHQPCTSCPPNYKLVDKNCVACPTYQVCNADRTALETAWHCGDGSLPPDSRMATVTRCDLDTGTETTTNICLNNGENKPSDSRCPVKPSDPDDVCPSGESLSWDPVIDDWACKTIDCEDDQWWDGSNCEDCDTYMVCPVGPPDWLGLGFTTYAHDAVVREEKWCQSGNPPEDKKMAWHYSCSNGVESNLRICIDESASDTGQRCRDDCPEGQRPGRNNLCEDCPTYKVCPDTGTEPINSAPFCGKNMPLNAVERWRYVLGEGFNVRGRRSCEIKDVCLPNGGKDWSSLWRQWHECCPDGFTMSANTRSCEQCENTYTYDECTYYGGKWGKRGVTKHWCEAGNPPAIQDAQLHTRYICQEGSLKEVIYCVGKNGRELSDLPANQSEADCIASACTDSNKPCWNGSACVEKPRYRVCANESALGTSLQSNTCAKPKEAITVRRDVCVGSNPMPREYCVGPGGYASVDSVPASQTASDCPPTVCTDPKPCLVNGRCEAKRPFDVDYMVCPGTRYSTDPNSLTVKPRPSGNREAVCSTTPRPVDARKESYEACNSSGTLETRYICVGENGAASVPPSATAPCTPTTPCSDEKWCDTTKPQGSRLSTRTVSRDVNGVCQTASNPPQIETDCDTSCTPKICEVDNNGANTGRVIDGISQSLPCPADKTRADCPVPPVVTRQVCASAIESTNRANADRRDPRDGARPPGQGAPVTHSFEECVSGVMTTKYICVGENGAASVPDNIPCPCPDVRECDENTQKLVYISVSPLPNGSCPTPPTDQPESDADCRDCIDTPDWSIHTDTTCGTPGTAKEWVYVDPSNPGAGCLWDNKDVPKTCEGWGSNEVITITSRGLPDGQTVQVEKQLHYSVIGVSEDIDWGKIDHPVEGFVCDWRSRAHRLVSDSEQRNKLDHASRDKEEILSDGISKKIYHNQLNRNKYSLVFNSDSCEWEADPPEPVYCERGGFTYHYAGGRTVRYACQ